MSVSNVDKLALLRTLGARRSQDVVRLTPAVLSAGGLGDQEWAIREQLAIAALDLGQTQLANDQLAVLQKQFPGSPRVDLVNGLRYECQGDIASARGVYAELLKADETDISAHQRLIALALPSAQATIPLLVTYLDTFYSDPTAWSLLADLYADVGLYQQSLAALSHLLLLQTWDSFAMTRAGETAYTLGDYHLAVKQFLRAVEMEASSAPRRTRMWWGLKASIRHLLTDPDAPTSLPIEGLSTRSQLEKLDQIATERLLAAGGRTMSVRRQVLSGV
ncbi:Inositol phosphatase SIW14 [Cryptotrichosporon argae]